MSSPSSSQLPQSSLGEQEQDVKLEEMPITKHLMILRQHLFKIVAAILLLFSVYYPLPIVLIKYSLNRYELSCL